jgi:hypothetical protein
MPEVTEELIADLPEPVQRSLRRSGVVGRRIPDVVTVWQEGRIRTSPERRWLPFTAREQYRLDQPGFVWNAALKMAGMTLGRATDSLDDGHGRMKVRLLGLFTVVDEVGPEMDQGSLMRWLNETMWFPAAWATDVISWEPIDAVSAVGAVRSGENEVRGEFRFHPSGQMVDFLADRYRDVGERFEMTPWCTPITGHNRFEGIEVPTTGSAVWLVEGGTFEYIQIRVTKIRSTP